MGGRDYDRGSSALPRGHESKSRLGEKEKGLNVKINYYIPQGPEKRKISRL